MKSTNLQVPSANPESSRGPHGLLNRELISGELLSSGQLPLPRLGYGRLLLPGQGSRSGYPLPAAPRFIRLRSWFLVPVPLNPFECL